MRVSASCDEWLSISIRNPFLTRYLKLLIKEVSRTDVLEHAKCQELMFLGTPKCQKHLFLSTPNAKNLVLGHTKIPKDFSDSKSFSVPMEF